jgi:hypothetical protein
MQEILACSDKKTGQFEDLTSQTIRGSSYLLMSNKIQDSEHSNLHPDLDPKRSGID